MEKVQRALPKRRWRAFRRHPFPMMSPKGPPNIKTIARADRTLSLYRRCVQFSIVKGTRTVRKTTLDLKPRLSCQKSKQEGKPNGDGMKEQREENEYARRWRAENKEKAKRSRTSRRYQAEKEQRKDTTLPTTKQIGTRSVQR